MRRAFCALLLASLLPATGAWASADAFDDAADVAYVDGWQDGDDGGAGFESWLFTEGPGCGYATGTSTLNGDGDSDGNDDIDSSASSWSAWSEGAGNVAQATRPFIGNLDPGQVVAADVDYDPAGGEVVFALQTATGANRFRFATSPATGARLLDAGALDLSSVLPASDEGLFLQFVLTGPDTYVVVLTPGDGGVPVEFERMLGGTGGIDRLTFTVNAEGEEHREAFLNRIMVPEPASGAALSAIGALLLVARRRAP
jgi:hypothetical protein